MPLIKSTFIPSLLFRNGHFNTIYRQLVMRETNHYNRKRIMTWDHDFIDLDFSEVNSNKLVILIHGLEGSSESNYVLSSSKVLNAAGYDTVSLNLRGCSGEDNLLLSTYHSGKTDDLDFVISYILENYSYEKIMIVGFSLGGNLTLKYFGEYDTPDQVSCGVAVSVPIDLKSSCEEMSKPKNLFYMLRFLKSLRSKVIEKSKKYPNFKINLDTLLKAKSFKEFDELYTAPVFGFSSPQDYWEKASCKEYIPKINKPTLLVSSKDDPFLGEKCYPYKEAENSKVFHLEVTEYGGHVAFLTGFFNKKTKWLENRILHFLEDNS
ncbi:MAG: Putative aminoacrylate hydrolase RutD [Flavobacterium sp. SCGC AAA160-P02]|nr:MAG: Putative aminoacrylate hydrolase RutD [Flavobacterium sp. SCGC AAA160-P02]